MALGGLISISYIRRVRLRGGTVVVCAWVAGEFFGGCEDVAIAEK